MDSFEDDSVHFLDLLILDDLNIDIYRKSTFTGNYINYDSYVPWYYKISWIKSIIFRAKIICSSSILFTKQLKRIDDYMSWNGFPRHVRKSVINKFLKVTPKNKSRTDFLNSKVLWFNIPYLGPNGEYLLKKFKQKYKKNTLLVIFNYELTITLLNYLCSAY